jgi:hypothetical protein
MCSFAEGSFEVKYDNSSVLLSNQIEVHITPTSCGYVDMLQTQRLATLHTHRKGL